MLYERQTTNHDYPAIKFSSENLKQQFHQTIGELYVSNQHRPRQLKDSIYGIEIFVSLSQPTSFDDIQAIIDEFFHHPHTYEVMDVVFSPYEMGKYVVSLDSISEDEVEECIDFTAIGKLIAQKENGIYTEYGYILYKGLNQKVLDIFERIKIKYPL